MSRKQPTNPPAKISKPDPPSAPPTRKGGLMMPWPKPIPATEPPKANGPWLVYLRYSDIWTEAFYGRVTGNCDGWYDDDGRILLPTHYMPQPPAPGEG